MQAGSDSRCSTEVCSSLKMEAENPSEPPVPLQDYSETLEVELFRKSSTWLSLPTIFKLATCLTYILSTL
jgi:hypothetical protein